MVAKKRVSLEDAMGGGALSDPTPDARPVAAPPPPSANLAKMTVYMPKSAARRLKQMALDHDCRVNDYLQEAVDLMFAKYGQPALKDYEK